MTDPFAGPAPIASEFASLASFRGRLVLIEPTKFEKDVPSTDDPSKVADRITATITTVDGQGRVQLFPGGAPSGQYLDGPAHEGVWLSQDRVVKALMNRETGQPHKMVLARVETFKPGQPAKKGNPWGLLDPSEADKQLARDFLAGRTLAAAVAPAEDENPFATKAPF